MKNKWLILCFFALTGWGFSQIPDAGDIFEEIDNKTNGNSSLPESLASGANYYTFVPLQTGMSDLIINNQARFENSILFVGVNARGDKATKVINVKDESFISRDELAEFKQVYFISMQSFHVQAETPISVFGVKTRHFTTVTPTRNLRLLEVENAIGKVFMVGVTADGVAHYPVYGMQYGRYDADDSIIKRRDGLILDYKER